MGINFHGLLEKREVIKLIVENFLEKPNIINSCRLKSA